LGVGNWNSVEHINS